MRRYGQASRGLTTQRSAYITSPSDIVIEGVMIGSRQMIRKAKMTLQKGTRKRMYLNGSDNKHGSTNGSQNGK